ncbi:beta-galactosidase [Microbacterium foliorum]|uniref:Beta-galactosidase n=1 Tax=Microbacterium foliorum TaxID=104336 RepID=A0A0F0KX57_9MICO|nr:beta-galactosidase [Microbacterium foliorum]AXL13469.1 beta-galactosidase [Microbacterium foliorum]KJL25059.1 Beta-galactosidase [Microbacterium foliorum]
MAAAVSDRIATLSAGRGLVFGCDYNPEQWDRSVWPDDVRLMQQAGVGLVAINIFGWSSINPAEGVWDFDALDEIIGLLHDGGIRINLGTGTASPAPWVTARHPEILPVGEDGTVFQQGGRQGYCPSSPVFRAYAAEVVTRVVERYGDHPAVSLWHVSNELGCHNALCYCGTSAEAFRGWLRDRYDDIDALNRAWGTTFWSQRYSDFDDVRVPAQALSLRNPGQILDFQRFSSDEQLALYRAEAAILRKRSDVPVTTNFMVTAHIRNLDYWTWAGEMDLIANDHYLDRRLDDPRGELSFAADLTRGLAQGAPWLLMETSTGAVNWQPYNLAKAPGELQRNIAAHVARGADGICFFQWRASTQGAEKYHTALVPHAGEDSDQWREVVALGGLLERLGEVAGTRVIADAALFFSWESWWATENEGRPSEALTYLGQVHAAHAALADAGVTTDVVRPGGDLDGYRLLIVPALHLLSDADAAAIARAVENGATALITFFSGIVDEEDRVRTGGYPGAFRDLLGIRSEEFAPLRPDETVFLTDGTSGSIWTERLRATDAEVVASFADGPSAGGPALTRRTAGAGEAWFVATQPDRIAYRDLVARLAATAGVVAHPGGNRDVEIVRRSGDAGSFLFVINHGESGAEISATGHDLVTDAPATGFVPAGAVRIIKEDV